MRRQVTQVLNRLAFAYDVLGRQGGRAFAAAAWSVRGFKSDLADLRAAGRLTDLRGVGPRVAQVITEVLDGEEPTVLTELEAQIPEGLFLVGKVRGLGAKKVRVVWQDLGVTTLGELEYACRENRLVELKGFGAKTQAKVVEGIELLRASEGLCRLDQGWAIAQRLLAEADGVVTGPLRRGCEVVASVDLLLRGEPPEIPEGLGVEVRLHRCDDPQQWGARLALTTGSEGHLTRLRERALEVGLRLDDGGLHEGEARRPCPEEADLYHALGVHVPSPQRREDPVALVLRSEPSPRLVQRSDLRGALHNHTTASDGVNTLEEMRAAAADRSLSYLGISDHSHTAFYAHGLTVETLEDQAAAIAQLNAEDHPCHLLTGVESDILADGALDYPPEVLRHLDLVIASVHNRHGQSGEPLTARMETAAQDPYTDVVGHPTGRLLLGRPPSKFDVTRLLDACAESGCAVELNASPQRLDLHERHLGMARERGLLVSIAADAHSVEGLDNLEYGVLIARRAGLTPDDVLNCRPLEALRAWLGARRSQALARRL